MEMNIDDLELSARSSNCLKRAGIETVGALLDKDMSELIPTKFNVKIFHFDPNFENYKEENIIKDTKKN